MKCFTRWQRISILLLLSLSVFFPIFLLFNRLQNLTSEGRRVFVEDLPTIKYRTDILPLSIVGQETRDGVKEPHPDVYEDQNSSVVSSQNEGGFSNSRGSRAGGSRTLERRANELGVREETKPIQQKEEPSPRIIKDHLNKSYSQHDNGVRAPHVITAGHGQDSHTQRVRYDKVKQMKDQVIRAKAYLGFATSAGNTRLVRELKLRTREVERALTRVKRDSDLSRRALRKIKNMEHTLSKASRTYSDCSNMINMLLSMENNAENQVQLQRNQATFLTELAGRTTPKGLHCLSMRLTEEYFALQPEKQVLPNQHNAQNLDLLHYVVFSDNVLAAAAVVNSTVSNTKEPEKIVFHVMTDSLNFPGISMWFLSNPLGEASIQVLRMEDFHRQSTVYDTPPEKQHSSDPSFSSLRNHLHFYLPEIFPHLNKILFLDHDVVVQKDLSGLFMIDMKGKVNGAVHNCQESESLNRQMEMLNNFSDPWVASKFDANACTWALGVNLFDLRQWRKKDLTASYHRLLLRLQRDEKPSSTAGSLPLSWITFYNETLPVDRRWHLKGLGYNSQVRAENIENAAVIQYDGIMKPWLDIGIRRYKRYWNKYIDFDHPFLQQCNLHG